MLRGQGAALYGPRACDKNMMTAIQALYRDDLDHGRAIRLWLYVVAALIFAMVVVGGATRLTESGLSITEWQPVTGALPPLSEAQWQMEFQKYQAIPQYRQLNAGMSLADFKTIYWWEWTHRLIGRGIGVIFFVPFVWFLWRGWIPRNRRAGLWLILVLGASAGRDRVVDGSFRARRSRRSVYEYRLATHLVLACLIYVAVVWTGMRWQDERAHALLREIGQSRPTGDCSRRRHWARGTNPGADLSRRFGRRFARRACIQHLAVDRWRPCSAVLAPIFRGAVVAEFF